MASNQQAHTFSSSMLSPFINSQPALPDERIEPMPVSLERPRAYSQHVVELFAPAFGVSDPEQISRVAEAVASFDQFCRSIDNAADRPKLDVLELHSGSLALMEGLSRAQRIVRDPGAFFTSCHEYLRLASEGERYLWRHKGTVASFDSQSIKMLGQKNSAMKTALAILAGQTGKYYLLPPLERSLEKISVGVQLLDDLLDWREDLASQTYTYPLVLAERAVGLQRESGILHAIFCGGVARQVLHVAIEHLSSAAPEMCSARVSSLSSALQVLREMDQQLACLPRESDPRFIERAFAGRLPTIVCYSA